MSDIMISKQLLSIPFIHYPFITCFRYAINLSVTDELQSQKKLFNDWYF